MSGSHGSRSDGAVNTSTSRRSRSGSSNWGATARGWASSWVRGDSITSMGSVSGSFEAGSTRSDVVEGGPGKRSTRGAPTANAVGRGIAGGRTGGGVSSGGVGVRFSLSVAAFASGIKSMNENGSAWSGASPSAGLSEGEHCSTSSNIDASNRGSSARSSSPLGIPSTSDGVGSGGIGSGGVDSGGVRTSAALVACSVRPCTGGAGCGDARVWKSVSSGEPSGSGMGRAETVSSLCRGSDGGAGSPRSEASRMRDETMVLSSRSASLRVFDMAYSVSPPARPLICWVSPLMLLISSSRSWRIRVTFS